MNESQNDSVTVIVSDPSRSIGVIQSGILTGRNAEILDLSEQVKPGERIQVQLVSEANGMYQVRMVDDEPKFFIDSARLLMDLERTIDDSQKELQKIENNAAANVGEAHSRKNGNIQSINSQIQKDLQKHEKDKLDALKLIDARKQRFYQMEAVVQNVKNRVTSSGLISRGNSAACFDKTDRSRRDIESVFEGMKDLNAAFFDERMKDVTDKGDRDKSQEEKRFAENLKTIAADRAQALENFEKSVSQTLNRQYNGDRAQRYSAAARSLRYSPAGYRSPEDLPPAILLGDAVLNLTEFPSDLVRQQAETELTECLKNGEIRLPLTADTTKNYSMLIEHDRESRDFAARQLSLILENMFYSYPGGRLEATLIDPLNTGRSFVDILKFGTTPSTQRLINDKAWSNTMDINKVLSGIQEKITNHISNYGDDHRARLEKEPTIVLAITDFPEHFDNAGLQILHTIVRQAQSGGVIVLIDADKELLKGAMEKNSDCKKVVEMMTRLDATGNRLVFKSSQFGRCHFEPDQLLDVDAAARKRMAEEVIQQADRGTRPVAFEEMFDFDIFDENNWFKGNDDGLHIPLGIRGANTVVKLEVGQGNGSIAHHAMIAGTTGAGKSTCLHTLIMSSLLNYSPEDLQIYLLDFKEGVELKPYTQYRIPNLRTVAVNSVAEFGIKVLKDLVKQIRNRSNIFQQKHAAGLDEYNAACLAEGRPQDRVPKILMIFDEVNELFNKNHGNNEEIISALRTLTAQGRSMGVFIVLACQDFGICPGAGDYGSQMAIRIAIKGSANGYSSVLDSGNQGGLSLNNQPPGTAIYNKQTGDSTGNILFRVAMLNEEKRDELLKKLDQYYRNPMIADNYKRYQTRVLTQFAQDDVQNPFNQIIRNEKPEPDRTGRHRKGVGLYLGLNHDTSLPLVPALETADRENLLLITPDEKAAAAFFAQMIMSIQAYGVANPSHQPETILVDLGNYEDEESFGFGTDGSEMSLKEVSDLFENEDGSGTFIRENMRGLSQSIDQIWDLVNARADGEAENTHDIYLMLFGLNRAHILIHNMYSQSETLEKLQTILRDGPKYGIHTIVWGESYQMLRKMFDSNFENAYFNARIVMNAEPELLVDLCNEARPDTVGPETAVYCNFMDPNSKKHFRAYAMPERSWLSQFVEGVDEMLEGE